MTEQPVALLTEETERRLEVLRRGIKRAAGFQLYVVLARDLARVELLRRLMAWSGVGGFPKLLFFPEGAPGALAVDRFLAAQDEEDVSAGAVIPDGEALIDAESGGAFANLNVSRDVLDKMIRGPLLLVLPPGAGGGSGTEGRGPVRRPGWHHPGGDPEPRARAWPRRRRAPSCGATVCRARR